MTKAMAHIIPINQSDFAKCAVASVAYAVNHHVVWYHRIKTKIAEEEM